MKNKLYFYSLSILFLSLTPGLQALKGNSLISPAKQEEPKIFVNNRILAKINGKPISTFDLMKKIDVSFYRHYPEYTSSVVARYQYYQMSWKPVLEEMIDKELILADAQESKIDTISNGDIRQEMEISFGPNIIANLDKVGLSFDEASKMMKEELIIRRMLMGRVNSKAIRLVTPMKVRQAYDLHIQDPKNARLTQWTYQVVTVRDRTLEKAQVAAQAAYQMLMDGIPLDQLPAKIKERKLLNRNGKVTVSEEVKNNDQELSKDYAQILTGLDTGMYSQPFSHKSRQTNSTVYRILFVKEKIPGGLPTFKEMESPLKENLLDEVIGKETDTYLMKLRQHYHIRQSDLDALLPQDYQPFLLK